MAFAACEEETLVCRMPKPESREIRALFLNYGEESLTDSFRRSSPPSPTIVPFRRTSSGYGPLEA